MFDGAQLIGFMAAVAVLVVVPGPNMMLILSHSLAGGRSVGFATAVGVETGTLVHTLAAALGLSAVLSSSPLLFDLLKYVGASYLALLGLRTLLRGTPERRGPRPAEIGPSRAYWRAVLTNVLNPKVALFFFALLPQFVRPERGHPFLQFLALGLIVVVIGLSFSTLIAVAAGSASAWLLNPTFVRRQERATGLVLIGLGIRLAFARRT